MQIRIELMSDACFSSGEVYNSSIDTDVTYDLYGLPFITGKRIKGCLREAGLELKEWGADIPLDEMFGVAGSGTSVVKISDAKLKGYDAYVRDITKAKTNETKMLVHPQRVLGEFTYTRSQTKIDDNKGVAKKETLRTTRVLKRGLVFISNVEITGSNEVQTVFADKLAMCCKALRSMGMNRTRGMGEVQVTLQPDGKEMILEEMAPICEEKQYSRLDYAIRLESSVLFKSILGGQTKTSDYVEGSKILGIIAQRMGDAFLDFMNRGDLICSNAYISQHGHRYLPMKASVFQVKNRGEEAREKVAILSDVEEKVQLNMSKGGYVYEEGDTYYVADVEKQIRYHHARPLDKGIGHASVTDETSQFYQMESILEGQVFAGSIYGTDEQIKTIYNSIEDDRTVRIGYAKNTEYGEATITVTNLREEQEEKQLSLPNIFLVRLVSPAILYNEYGMYSTEEACFMTALKEKLGLASVDIEKRFLKYTEMGGYNVTWDEKKATLFAFDKGTTFVCKTNEECLVSNNGTLFIGERNSEGFGEIQISQIPENYEIFIKKNTDEVSGAHAVQTDGFETELLDGIIKKACKATIEDVAIKNAAEVKVNDSKSAVVNQILSILKEQDTYEGFCHAINKRYNKRTESKQKKNSQASNYIKEKPENLRKELEKYDWMESVNITDNELYKWYYNSFLLQLKYKIREGKGE